MSKTLPAPLLYPALAWILGMVLARLYQPQIVLWAALALALVTLSLLSRTYRIWLVLALCVVAGAMRYQVQEQQLSPLSSILEQQGQIRQPLVFRVTNVFSATEHRYAVKLDSLAGLPLHESIIYRAESKLSPGKRYSGLAIISPLSSDPILDIYPHRYSASATQLGKLELRGTAGWSGLIAAWRQSMLLNLDAKLGDNSGWAKGLLLSDGSSKQEFRQQLSNSGIMHLIVVSGLHVWLIYAVLVSLLRVFFRRSQAELIFLLLILLFAALNNWAAPISRAIIMIGTTILARWMQRPLGGAQSLSFSLLLITLLKPSELFSIGFQLSFVAVAVILFGVPRIRLFSGEEHHKRGWQKGLESLLQGFTMSVLVSLAISPFTLFYFGKASLNGILGNIIGIPLISILLPLSGLILLLPKALYLSKALALSYNGLIWLWQSWIAMCASLPFSINGDYLGRGVAIALGLMLFWAFFLVRGKFRLALYAALPCVILSSGLVLLSKPKPESDIHVFSCGVADCSVLRLPGGQTLMVDTGGGPAFSLYGEEPTEAAMLNESWMQKSLLPWLGRAGIRKLDYLVLTHMHADHYGGLLALLSSVEVEHLFISQATQRNALWQFFVSRPYFKPGQVHVISDTCSFKLDAARLKFLHPDKRFFPTDENERSLVFRLDTRQTRILFTGDIGQSSEEHLAENYPSELACDYLKVPHHGSRGSSSSYFLALAHPREAWLSTSAHNRFGFPHPETLQRYAKIQAQVRSSAEGSIRKKIDSRKAI